MPSTSEAGRSAEAREYRRLYDTARWKVLRLEQLDAEPFCEYCKEEGRVRAATIADHVVPHKGDEELFFNGKLRSLCAPCHDSVKQSEERTGRRKGFRPDGSSYDEAGGWGTPEEPTSKPPMG